MKEQLSSLPDGFRSVVIGASGGIGSAICEQLETNSRAGDIIELSRKRDGFELLEEDNIRAHAARLEPSVHLIVCATGALTINDIGPEKSLRQLDPDAMLSQFKVNTIGPALIAKHFLPRLDRRTRTIALFLSARVGSIGDNRLGGWMSYRASKAALNQVVRTASIEMVRTHPSAIVASIHPGTVRTPLSEPYSRGHSSVSPDEAARTILRTANDLTQTGLFVAYDGTFIEW